MGKWLFKIALRALAVLLAVTAVVYCVDYVVFRVKMARGTGVEMVTIERIYAIPEKNKRTEYTDAGSVDMQCVHTLFPHMGYGPCWYVKKHTLQQINM